MDFKKELITLLSKELGEIILKKEDFTSLISVPPDQRLGDYAFPCFKLGKNPKEEAEKLKARIKLSKSFSKIEVAGPYLNFFICPEVLAKETLTKIFKEKEDYGIGKDKKEIVIEFCGPNTNKPLHLGHVRNMAIGDATRRILVKQGNNVHPVNIINDRGIHICQSMIAYQKWGKGKTPDKKGDHFVGDYYVLFSKKSKEDETMKAEAQELLLKWEQGDKETIKLWKQMNKWVLEGFKETYQRFGIKFEKEYSESDYYQNGKEIVLEGLKKKKFHKNEEGAIVVNLEEFNLPNKVVLRADGTSIYITQDMYLAQLRYDDFKFNKMVYVVASEQNNHFKQLFKILELLNKPYANNLYHLSYGLVNLPSGRMKSREGTVVDADDIMNEISSLAETEIRKRYDQLSEKDIKKRAEMIALGAIKFFMLKTDASRDIIFNPEESLSFEGETGPYLQYTHARSCSILRKAEKNNVVNDFSLLSTNSELAILKLLNQFPEKIKESAANYKPHLICRYLLDLAQAYNEFYHQSQVISEDKELMNARLHLVDSVRQVLHNGLDLLGIKSPEEM
ncbi:arginine--tRNA ligase [Candidatus Woesearchaeota archaeon CG_4_10_14_0_2_um_filter_33_13]|nr:MAG: arginine--tRNA ligase [Candidatus Woesearchaeota archaeon CG_4_10_14_0_2_um_filter_33_13]